jgi:hypothetical protein
VVKVSENCVKLRKRKIRFELTVPNGIAGKEDTSSNPISAGFLWKVLREITATLWWEIDIVCFEYDEY